MTRREILDDFAASVVTVDEGVSLRTDDAVEALHREWIRLGSPAGACAEILNVDGDHVEYRITFVTAPLDFFAANGLT